jgi:hypothetical protein
MAAVCAAAGLGGCDADSARTPGAVTPPPNARGPAPGAVPIRRLTNTEYQASVADLFPGRQLPQLDFVPDTRTLGFSNLSSSQQSSLVRMEQYESAAQLIAASVTADPGALTGCDAAVRGELACGQAYLYDLGKRAYRRPLSDAEKQALTALFVLDQDTTDYATRLGLGVQGILLSPKFLFRPEVGAAKPGAAVLALTPWELATRLSYFVGGSLPDAELAAAAEAGRLSDPAELRSQAERLLALPRAQAHLVAFHQQWLGTDTVSAVTKKADYFPQFSTALASYMGQETRAFIQSVMFAERGTFADLLLARHTFVNAPLAAFYGVPAPAADWGRVELDPTQRRGLLTQASLLATMAKADHTDPVRRGKFVLERMLCRTVPPPTPEIVAMFKPLDLSKTARDQFTDHKANPVCGGCHAILDPLGLPFEHYDALGQWRDDDRGMAIDATGSVDGVPFDGVPALAALLASKDAARACYVSQWFRLSAGRLNAASNPDDKAYLDWLSSRFTADSKLVDLVVEIVQSDSFRNIKVDATTGRAP